ncbi:MAG: DUF402 domain-containing protein [Chloroflexota bacterium]|nr:DUF402 domain-containing protein [Chloroflexota bacterium]MDE2908169.1 DUF402 domain-containing protein [Chloroflexota bacterium]
MDAFTIIKLDALGEFELSYEGMLRESTDSYVCIDAVFALPDRDLGYIKLRRGDRFREWFYRDRWYNIFRVEDVESQALKGWYCNITRSPIIGMRRVAAEDLCLDVFVYPDGRTLLLDEDDFADLSLAAHEVEKARQAVDAIRGLVDERLPPFDEIRPA